MAFRASRPHPARLGTGSFQAALRTARLLQAGFKAERQKSISFQFDGMHFDDAFCVNLLVENQVVIELKSVEKVAPVHQEQLLTCLRVLDQPVAQASRPLSRSPRGRRDQRRG